jgi:DNA-binding SARP family transcriptional activator
VARLRLLGRVEFHTADRPVDLGPAKQRAVLAALGADADRPVTTTELIARVWDDAPPTSARSALYSYITHLRKALATAGEPGVRLSYRSGGYVLEINPLLVDLHRFQRLVETARAADEDGDRALLLRQALDLWTGEPLADLSSEWAERLRDALVQEHIDALVLWSTTQRRLGQPGAAIGRLREAWLRHPLVEPLAACLIDALSAVGRDAEALDCYASTRRRLVDDLGTEPGAQLRALHRRLLRGPSAAAGAAEGPVTTREAARGTGTGGTRPVPRILPPDLPDFTGRQAELAAIRDALLPGGRNGPGVVAVTGAGGVGKTALAVHGAHALRDRFPDGDLYVNLRGVDKGAALRPAAVLARFLRALGVDGHSLPENLDERVDLYRNLLSERRVVIVLDNARDEDQIAPLIPASPSGGVIVTSRRRLGAVVGARTLALDVFGPDSATALLAGIVGEERLAAEPAATTALADLCGRLPLALRIAGSTLAAKPHWSVAKLVGLLRDERGRLDLFSHGRLDVRSSISLGYEGLSGSARRLLRRLADTAPTEFSAWLAEAVLDTTAQEAEVPLEQLIDAQLVDVAGRGFDGHPRYRLHDLVRLFGREKAAAEEPAGDLAAARDRVHGSWLSLLDVAHRAIHGDCRPVPPGRAPRHRIEAAVCDSVRAAPIRWWTAELPAIAAQVNRAAADGRVEACWELTCLCSPMFEMHRDFDDWQEMIDTSLAAVRESGDRRGYGAMLIRLGTLTAIRMDLEAAHDLFTRAVTVYLEAGDERGHALALAWLASSHRHLGRLRESLRCARAARAGLRAVGSSACEAFTEREIGMFYLHQNGLRQAARHLDRSMRLSRAAGDRRGTAISEFWLGMVRLEQGEIRAAQIGLHAALALTRAIEDSVGEAQSLRGLARCAGVQGDREQARAYLAEALEIIHQPSPTMMEQMLQDEVAALDAQE